MSGLTSDHNTITPNKEIAIFYDLELFITLIRETERPLNQIKCYSLKVIQKLKMLLIFCLVSGCNTVTGTVEGTSRGIIKDTKTIYHYSTCVFTKKQCGDLDLGD